MLTMTAAVLMGGESADLIGFRELLVISPTSDAVGGQFGASVDADGSVVIAGATDQDPDPWGVGGPGHASVLFFDEEDGSLVDRVDIQASDGVAEDIFGYSVAIGSIAGASDPAGVAFVAAPRRGGPDGILYAGGVYVFREDAEGISEVGLILPTEPAAFRFFGGSLDFDGTHLAVGAPFDSTDVDEDTTIDKHGSVWVFEIGSDGLPIAEHRLESNVPATGQYYGWSVSVDSDQLAVGSIQDNASGVQSGAVYIYDKQPDGSWTLDEVVSLSDLGDSEWFGTSVCLVDDRLIASTLYADNPSGADGEPVSHAGAAVVFQRIDGAFVETQRIYPPSDEINPGWGVDMDFDGSVLAIGANQWNDGDLIQTGAVGIYERGLDDQFSMLRTELTKSPTRGGSYGISVAIGTIDRVVVGMPDVLEPFGGKVCVLDVTCRGDDDGDGDVGVTDLLTLLESWGDTRIQAVDVVQDFEVNYLDMILLLDQFGSCGFTPPL
jgi:hypothetical protein